MINNHFTSNQAVLLVSLVSVQLASLFTFIYKNGLAAAAVPVALIAISLISCLLLALVFYFRNKRVNTALADEPHVSNAFLHFPCQIKSLFSATKADKSKQEAIAALHKAHDEQSYLVAEIRGALERHYSELARNYAEFQEYKKTLPKSITGDVSPPQSHNTQVPLFNAFTQFQQEMFDFMQAECGGEPLDSTIRVKDIVKKTASVYECNRQLKEFHAKTLLLSAEVIQDSETDFGIVKSLSQPEEIKSYKKFSGK